MSYELFIGLRYLKAKRKKTFISIITFISVMGVAVGVMALIIVLSVMTGFENDLREKILGVNAHLVVLEIGKGMKNYNEVAGRIKTISGVAGTTPGTSSSGSTIGTVLPGPPPPPRYPSAGPPRGCRPARGPGSWRLLARGRPGSGTAP